MVFSSPLFLFLFLPAVLLAYFLLGRRLRNTVLLLASLLFYAWGEPRFVLVMLGSIAINHGAGLLIARTGETYPKRAKRWLIVALVGNLGLLALFKYAGFLIENFNAGLTSCGLPTLEVEPIPLPIGISFFTFQAISYVVDVYRRDAPVQRNPLRTALYISMFPQLIAGPIVRYYDVAKQITTRSVDVNGFAFGVRRFVVGLAKKVLIANSAGVVADRVFDDPSVGLTAGAAWLGAACYSLQLYFDFSGYSDMAIGLGRMFGFRFQENFNYPYISGSISEFWRRWHISLSSWFRDYLYIPLGGNRRGPKRTYMNLVIVFFLCGLWHGASWSFVVWGLFHGTFLVLERAWLGPVLARLWRPLRHIYVVLTFMVGWVLFRAETLPEALNVLRAMVGAGTGHAPRLSFVNLWTSEVALVIALGIVGSTPWLPALNAWLTKRDRRRADGLIPQLFGPAAVFATACLLLLSAMRLVAGSHNPFIYFRF